MIPAPCPCCGQPFVADRPNALMFTGSFASIGPTRERVLDALCSYFPKSVSMKQIIDHCYWDDVDGGPLDPKRSIWVQICNLRKITRPLGWDIEVKFGVGYRLVQCEAVAP